MDVILNYSRKEYILRINMVQDYIEKHLNQELRVSELASIASFSEFHFQRIYKMMTGESLYSYIKRIRLEKAVFLLRTNKSISIEEIAYTTGFSNQASFAKALKESFGLNGSRIRALSEEKLIQLLDDNSRNGKVLDYDRGYNLPIGIYVKIIEPIPVLYLRHTGAYKGDGDLFRNLFEKLYSYGSRKGLISEKTQWFVVYHDFGEITDHSKLRLSVSMSLEDEYTATEEFGVTEISGGKYAVGKFILREDEYQGAWNYIFCKWLPESGYVPCDKPCFEYYPVSNNCMEGLKEVEIWIPVNLL